MTQIPPQTARSGRTESLSDSGRSSLPPDLLPPRPVAQHRRPAPARPHRIARDRHRLPAQPQAPPALHTPAADDRPPGRRTDPARTPPARWRTPADPLVTALAAPAAPAQGHQPAPRRPPRRGTHPRSDLPRRPRTSRHHDHRPAELSKDTFKQDPLANSRARHPAIGHPPRRSATTPATEDSSRQVSTHPARKIICHRTAVRAAPKQPFCCISAPRLTGPQATAVSADDGVGRAARTQLPEEVITGRHHALGSCGDASLRSLPCPSQAATCNDCSSSCW